MDDSGRPHHILVACHGWTPSQAKWRPQVQEAFAQKEAVIKYLYRFFPYSKIHLFCDNRNLATDTPSVDPTVDKYQQELNLSGLLVTRQWIPGEWNAIADHVSRIARLSSVETPDALAEARLYSVSAEVITSARDARAAASSAASARASGRGPPTAALTPTLQQLHTPVVHGHLHVPELVQRIARAQVTAPLDERTSWPSTHRSVQVAQQFSLDCYRGRYIIPKDASDIKSELLRLAHDAHGHLPGAERTFTHLQRHAQVWWPKMDDDCIS